MNKTLYFILGVEFVLALVGAIWLAEYFKRLTRRQLQRWMDYIDQKEKEQRDNH